ncbi:glycosyl transferase [Streptococcus pneumoniae]|uniref:Glycosyltransferase n=6 Tax=Streptococcus pneumoniae TaxID=1313 RepID=Q4K2F2_STREE|nr:glycosyltransferase family 4 protein [Streptococcus pneumoniae]EJG57573.1 glycosyl transferases group 1 family protein [Streptococcus pneumoniae 2080076]EJG36155.1 glycosyl transferases group 1 family protein [Streptococcus pneumoniae 2070035]MBW5100281.1 glycosyltransferase family 4 protein [Streptococcus pneumoniae]MBW7540026.1 glycosyltransferase family 4 protein [Streptococcus pneumoniae]MBW8147940.1 glycosyltransferase family 4 protein [Streptococcus pneumoniae]
MKKIALVKWILDDSGGGERVAVSLANELTKKYEVHLIGITTKQSDLFFGINSQVKYSNFFDHRVRLSKNILKISKMLKKYFLDNEIEVAFGIGIFSNIFLSLSGIGISTKVVLCDHTNSITANRELSKKVQRYVGTKLADKIITLTQEDRKNYIRKYGISENRIAYIYNWKENRLSNIPYNDESTKIVTVGRFDYQKGYDYLIQVAKKVLAKMPDWTWEIYGSGKQDEVDKIRDLITENDLQDKLVIKGLEKNQDLIYGDKGIYVMTSRYEGLPLVLLEAQQYNLPIVSFRCPTGPSEIVEDGVNGYLIDCYDTDKMSEKLLELMKNDDLRQSFSDHAKDTMDKFDKNKILNQWIELIETI